MMGSPVEWAEIPKGSIMETNEEKRYDDETQHQVTLSAFCMSKYAITFEQYDAFCDEMGREKPDDFGWGRKKHPVCNVSWDDASDFARWVGGRLPTEAEWDYACRAGTTTSYNTGKTITNQEANIEGEKNLPVGLYNPNSWGLYDMHGNVWEWCADWYGEYSTGFHTNPQGPTKGLDRVFRGGCQGYFAFCCRSANRNYSKPTRRHFDLGFRLVFPK